MTYKISKSTDFFKWRVVLALKVTAAFYVVILAGSLLGISITGFDILLSVALFFLSLFMLEVPTKYEENELVMNKPMFSDRLEVHLPGEFNRSIYNDLRLLMLESSKIGIAKISMVSPIFFKDGKPRGLKVLEKVARSGGYELMPIRSSWKENKLRILGLILKHGWKREFSFWGGVLLFKR
ncbi:hypothetical protein [Shewanella algae]|jgi:hypothetical protein|uniref:hypothetical protein n=1 Tax=Shewanella algae TaxID=38313 RepID=UPI001182006A|nr:hypothetical protein [Shewanella algae]MBO2558959.1 hypothetical protein [Shewanella algae]MBO2575888.1 hypothetical protein [Shewanella algae]TVO83381.1 hypothetical protein AYI80_19385 [Shewanella algae]TXS83030.1 hypothetical protein AYI81_20485 [Shewanella algae]